MRSTEFAHLVWVNFVREEARAGQSRLDDRTEQVTETVLGERSKRGEKPKTFLALSTVIMD